MTSALGDPEKIGTDLPVALRRNRTDPLAGHFERTRAQSGERWRQVCAPFAGEAVAIFVDVLAEVLLTLKTAVQTIVQVSLRGTLGPTTSWSSWPAHTVTPTLGLVPRSGTGKSVPLLRAVSGHQTVVAEMRFVQACFRANSMRRAV